MPRLRGPAQWVVDQQVDPPSANHPSSLANRDRVCVSSSRVDVDEQVRGIGGKAAGPCREPELAAGGMLFLSQRCWCWRLSMALPTHM